MLCMRLQSFWTIFKKIEQLLRIEYLIVLSNCKVTKNDQYCFEYCLNDNEHQEYRQTEICDKITG